MSQTVSFVPLNNKLLNSNKFSFYHSSLAANHKLLDKPSTDEMNDNHRVAPTRH